LFVNVLRYLAKTIPSGRRIKKPTVHRIAWFLARRSGSSRGMALVTGAGEFGFESEADEGELESEGEGAGAAGAG